MKAPRLNLLIALFVAVFPAVAACAQTAPTGSTNAPAQERFLVIVETSAAMQKRAENTQKALGSIISSGLKGQIESGSTIGLWTYNEKLFTGQIPLQLWTEPTRQQVALTMVQTLQQQKFEKAARLGAAWAVATNIVAQSERITVLLFSSGSEPVVGTPYDASILESFGRNAEQQRKANMPFLTILRAVNGKFVAFAVNMPPWPLEVPEWPAEFKPKPAPLTPKAAPAVPVVATPPPTVKRVDPAVLSPTNTIYLVEPTPPAETAAVAAPAQPTNSVVVAPKATEPSHPNAAVAVTPVEAKPKPAREPSTAPQPTTAEPAETKPKLPIVPLLIAGICVLLGIMVVFIMLLRWSRRSTGESLITRSMDRNDR
ncbi:MAG: hypothetical protein QM813_26635 [Verrucomicrobiota bacterium]